MDRDFGGASVTLNIRENVLAYAAAMNVAMIATTHGPYFENVCNTPPGTNKLFTASAHMNPATKINASLMVFANSYSYWSVSIYDRAVFFLFVRMFATPPSPTPSSPSPTWTELDGVILVQQVIGTLAPDDVSIFFDLPDPAKVLDYYDVIERPISFSRILENVKRGDVYATPEAFVADIQLLFDNCFEYNWPWSRVGMLAQSLERTCNALLEPFGLSLRPRHHPPRLPLVDSRAPGKSQSKSHTAKKSSRPAATVKPFNDVAMRTLQDCVNRLRPGSSRLRAIRRIIAQEVPDANPEEPMELDTDLLSHRALWAMYHAVQRESDDEESDDDDDDDDDDHDM